MKSILIVDDDEQLGQSFARLLREEGYTVQAVNSGETALLAVQQQIFGLVIMDVRMPGINGLETLQELHKIESRLPVIVMTAYGTTQTAIEATKRGAFDYLLKPFEIPEMLNLIEQALEAGRFMRSPVQVDGLPEDTGNDAIIGRSPAMQKVYKAIGRVAATDATVLLRGESGTGKELIARALYQHSLRAQQSFLVINCVAIPETLLESELFGYERGAFTGAHHRRVGKIEQARKGTIFLDEIGDMPFPIQAKILRLLQEKSIERLGGRETIPVDVRVIAATNRNLEEAIQEGRFREDLYYRLNVVTIELPPLRARTGDIPLLCDYFLSRFSRDMEIPNPGISPEAREAVSSFSWPGNVRELANTMQKALIFSRGCPIRLQDISQAMDQRSALALHPIYPPASDQERSLEEIVAEWIRSYLLSSQDSNLFTTCLDRFSRLVISEALTITEGNRTQAARLLGLSRPTLQAKIGKYELNLNTSIHKEKNGEKPGEGRNCQKK